ncbi:MAG: hypothetical protein JWQ28_984 [Pedobacter sp.]|jgi:uncharacterized membrane protein|nr:hypothetical protein [Pedobacter sp.]
MKKDVKRIFVDKDVQVILGTLLRFGVILSMVVVLIGGMVYLNSQGKAIVDYSQFRSEHADLTSIKAIFSGLLSLQGKAIIQFGIVLLIFTPISRVIFSVFGFLLEKDYMYVVIGLIVLSIIIFSLTNKLVG